MAFKFQDLPQAIAKTTGVGCIIYSCLEADTSVLYCAASNGTTPLNKYINSEDFEK